MTALSRKEQWDAKFNAAMEEAYAEKGCYFIVHWAANRLEEQMLSGKDRHGRKISSTEQERMKKEIKLMRDAARPLNN
jgi:hypothetical protein